MCHGFIYVKLRRTVEINSVHKVSFRSIILDDLIRSNCLRGNVNAWWIEQYLMTLLDALSTNRHSQDGLHLFRQRSVQGFYPRSLKRPRPFLTLPQWHLQAMHSIRLIDFEERRQLTPNMTTLKGLAATNLNVTSDTVASTVLSQRQIESAHLPHSSQTILQWMKH